ncbi:hypothetical protein Y032_0053g2312 [Ancylostoma ceylanicum]|nr:hypothetical protein Y032_0053g2312 [Ancylostoma ceylanicum]
MNEKRPTWRCPVCSGPAAFKNIIIDEYFQNMLTNVDCDTTEVELLVDGSYKTVKAECVDLDDDDIPTSTAAADRASVGSGDPSTSAPSSAPPRPRSHDDDIIVLSDSDDEDGAVQRAIRASMADSTISAPKPTSPTPRSRDSSIIIIDDESPPRPQQQQQQQQAQNKTCNGAATSMATLSPPSTSTCALGAPSVCSSTITSNGVLGNSRVAAPQPQSVLSGHQSIYNTTTPLSYYHQSQWSQPAASRPQYPTPQSQPATALSAGSAFSYKPPQPLPMILGRYQPGGSTVPFGYSTASAASQASQHFAGGTNLQQVLASLVQQSAYANGAAGAGSTNTSQ